MKIAMGKSGVFDSKILVLRTQFCFLDMLNPKRFTLLLRDWALIPWLLCLYSEVAEP